MSHSRHILSSVGLAAHVEISPVEVWVLLKKAPQKFLHLLCNFILIVDHVLLVAGRVACSDRVIDEEYVCYRVPGVWVFYKGYLVSVLAVLASTFELPWPKLVE